MKSTIILPKGEIPISNPSGDDKAFEVELLKEKDSKYDLNNVITVKAKMLGSDTNLTILTQSGRIYSFYLYSTSYESKKEPNLINYVTLDGKIPKVKKIDDLDIKDKKIVDLEKQIKNLQSKLQINQEEKSIDIKSFNINGVQFDYKFDKNDFKVEAIFNDKNYTYIKFKNGYQIPKLYYINELNDKISTPFSIDSNILKVKKLAKDWTLELNNSFLRISKLGNFKIKEYNKKWFVDMTTTNFEFFSPDGDKTLAPEVVFHDNQFTYFKFNLSNGFKKLPTLFKVIDGYDNPIFNYEVVGDFIVAKLVHKKFTLRLGEKHYCIRYEDE